MFIEILLTHMVASGFCCVLSSGGLEEFLWSVESGQPLTVKQYYLLSGVCMRGIMSVEGTTLETLGLTEDEYKAV